MESNVIFYARGPNEIGRSEFDDWRLEMSRLLQSVPFADE